MEFLNNVLGQVKSFCQTLRETSPKYHNSIPDPNLQDIGGGQLEILLLDVSGSMADTDYKPTRLDGAKRASTGFISRIMESNQESFVAIINFSSTASVVCMPISVKSNIASLKQLIHSLTISGGTNIPAGLKLSEKVIRKCKNAVNPRILLLTDGENLEDGSPVPVAERLKSQGIQIDIIGIGGSPSDVNEKDLKEMASVVNGELRYWFIKSAGELVKKFEDLAIREIK